MKRTFTKLMTALALLLFITPPLVGWGQTYSLYSGQLVEGDYLIYYNGKAMNTTTNSNRLQYAEVTPANDVITTNLTNIVWHIAPDGDYWTIYNASEAKYAVSTGTKNQATTSPTLDDKARWTVSGTSTYEFVNKYNNNNNINKNLRNNGTYGFACYSTTTGGALSLYKLEESQGNTPSITANNVELAYDATESAIAYTINNPVEGGVLTAATDAEWLTIGTVGETVPFTCTMNDDGERMATVTLTYTYDTDQTVTKNVTVTQGNSPNAPGTEGNPYTVAQARAAIDAGTGTQGVYATGIVSAIPTAYNSTYSNITFNMVDEEGDEVFLQAYRCGGDEAANVAIGDVVVVYGNLIKYNTTYEFGQGCEVVSLTHPVVPSITVTPATVNATVEGGEGILEVNYQNITEIVAEVFFCNAEGEEATYDWITATINDDNNVDYIIESNEGEARTAYLKVYALDDDAEDVYSNLVTIEQDEYVAPTYAELPFTFNSGKADIEGTDGLYQEGLGSDYNANNNPTTKLKFDGAGDWLLLQFSERPGTLTFDVKGNSFSGGTFTVQASEDGTTYTDLATYTELTSTVQNEAFTDLGENVRYIKWIYTNKSSGNVGLGNITLAKYVEPVIVASITVNPNVVDAPAAGEEGTLSITLSNMTISDDDQLDIVYYYATGEQITNQEDIPNWLECIITKDNEAYVVYYSISQSTNIEAQSAYFKVYGLDDDGETEAYSNLVTINQAGVPQQYTLTVEPFENLELITFVNDEMVMEGDGEITVTEGDQIMLSIVANEGYVMETLMVNGVNHVNDIADDFTYTFEMPSENVTISATAIEDVPPTPGEWVMVSLNDLTENDVFVIVGVYDEDESSYAMPNNSTGAPSAVEVTMVGNTLSGDIDDNLKWNLSIGEDGYTFYPNGETESWLYCNNSNNGVRVGTNENNVFSMTSEGYLFNNATGRYIGIYNSQDWRCYTSINNNIKEQTFAFYKRVDASEIETYTLDITGYGDSDGGYYLIASPVSMIRPTAENGFLTETYDLYYFDQSQEGEEWRNYEAKHFNIASGKGYLYASQENTTLTFTGVPYTGNGTVELSFDENNTWGDENYFWNLVGNPFGQTAYIDRDFYAMNEDGSEIMTDASNGAVEAMQGIFVLAEENGETLTFMTEAPVTAANLTINLSQSRGAVIDRAIVRFNECRQLPKFQLNAESTKLYIPQGSKDYAVVRSNAQGEMPVNFKADKKGTYTISINAENVEMEYLHLIDNMTDADVDLLATPSYTFDANTTDYASRFRLVFSANNVNDNTTSETFAYFNGSEWSISNTGRATLQVVDVLGRIVSSESVNGNTTLSTTNLKDGVYMFRLVNGENVKVQKVVVK